MSFGANNTTKAAENNLGGLSNDAFKQSDTELGAGKGLLDTGSQNLSSGTNFFDTLLNGNQANTTAMLQPNIDQIRSSNQNALQTANTLMPRGGGRSATLFQSPFNTNAQIQNLFNGARSGAASNLAQIGAAQQGMGANMFGISNQPLNTAAGANSSLGNMGFQQQEISNKMMSGLGAGLFNLFTLPFTGGATASGLFK